MNNIIDILVCPITKGRLEYDQQKQLLISKQAKLAFKIVDGIPNMLIEDAIDLGTVDLELMDLTAADLESDETNYDEPK